VPAAEGTVPDSELSFEAGDLADKVTMSRRTLLGSSAAAAAAAYVASFSSSPVARYLDGVDVRLVDEAPSPHSTGTGNGIFFHVERDSDLLLLDFGFYGFKLDTSSHPVALVPTTVDNWIIVQFPPQAIGEGVYNEKVYPPPKGTLDSPPVQSVLAGPSQLAFSIRKGLTVPLTTMTVEDLLDWSTWTLLVPPVAIMNELVDGKPPLPSFPKGNTTLIECPYGLYLSPVVNPGEIRPRIPGTTSWKTSFAGTVQPKVSADGVTECWPARLTYSEQLTVDGHVVRQTPLEPEVSAVWCRELELYANTSGTGVSTWVPWTKTNSKKQVVAVLDNEKYFATPNTSRIPLAE
jgi:hypothetical protein